MKTWVLLWASSAREASVGIPGAAGAGSSRRLSMTVPRCSAIGVRADHAEPQQGPPRSWSVTHPGTVMLSRREASAPSFATTATASNAEPHPSPLPVVAVPCARLPNGDRWRRCEWRGSSSGGYRRHHPRPGARPRRGAGGARDPLGIAHERLSGKGGQYSGAAADWPPHLSSSLHRLVVGPWSSCRQCVVGASAILPSVSGATGR